MSSCCRRSASSGTNGLFEQAVLGLLIAMGYGGADRAATRTQPSNDGGIDGIIDQNTLGLSRVYVQAKQYALDAAVGDRRSMAFRRAPRAGGQPRCLRHDRTLQRG